MKINIREYKDFVNNLDENAIDIIGNEYTACWLFAYYIHCKYDLPISNYEPVYEIENITEMYLDRNGIYSYHMSTTTEMHHFILYVNDDDVILMSTYGGQPGIIKIKYNKHEFINEFNDMIVNENKRLKKYRKLFGIKKTNFSVLNMTDFALCYTYKECIN
jgi:hypothetical protein